MEEFIKACLTRGFMSRIVSHVALGTCGIRVLVIVKAVRRYFCYYWFIFAEGICLCYPEGLHLVIIRSGPVLPYAYEQNIIGSLLLTRFCKAFVKSYNWNPNLDKIQVDLHHWDNDPSFHVTTRIFSISRFGWLLQKLTLAILGKQEWVDGQSKFC